MAILTPAYCSREDVKRSLDIKETSRNNTLVDRAIASSTANITRNLHRTFHPLDTTKYWDWPNFQRSYPWRIWFDQSELADVTVNPPVVTTGGVTIPDSAIFWGPWNYAPPYTFMELDRSQSYAFGVGSTPQRDIAITGTFGYWLETDPGGTLAAAVSTTTATTLTVSDSSLMGVGDLLIIDTERLLVQDRATSTTGQTNVSGATTASAADDAITVSDGTQVHADEVLLIDSERMLVVDVAGDVVTVKRAWDGTILATHNTATTIYAYRLLTVGRAQLGTTAATHSNGATVSVFRVPPLIRDLAIAESGNSVLQKSAGYAEAIGIGSSLADLWDEAETAYGRILRQRVV